MFRLSTLIPEGNQPRTENETDAEFGMRLALIWVLVFRGAVWNIEKGDSGRGGGGEGDGCCFGGDV